MIKGWMDFSQNYNRTLRVLVMYVNIDLFVSSQRRTKEGHKNIVILLLRLINVPSKDIIVI